jgi:hypothetical protein
MKGAVDDSLMVIVDVFIHLKKNTIINLTKLFL